MHLRVKFFRGRRGVERPADIVLGEVVGAVACVPCVPAGGPGQLAREGGDEVVECPGHDGVVVGGDVEGDDADGEPDPWRGGRARPSLEPNRERRAPGRCSRARLCHSRGLRKAPEKWQCGEFLIWIYLLACVF